LFNTRTLPEVMAPIASSSITPGLLYSPRFLRLEAIHTPAAVEKDEASYSTRYFICIPPFSKGG
jgi:hypothetical protein